MNQFLTVLSRAVLVLAFLQGQLAFAAPSMAAQMGAGCGQPVAAPTADQHHGRYHVHGEAGTHHGHRDESPRQQEQHQAHSGDTGCEHACQNDGSCNGCSDCNVCGHCHSALAVSPQALIPSPSEMLRGVTLLAQDFHPSPIFQPPRSSVQS